MSDSTTPQSTDTGSNTELPVANTSMRPEPPKPAPAVVDLMQRAVQGAHQTIDRLADKAAPAVQKLGAGMADAGDALQAKSDQLVDTRDEWAESLRSTVRAHPLMALAAALAIGALVARIKR
jgi:ElaB/YqjD/DUF883 family membrane-anchored ribosome-binding protein